MADSSGPPPSGSGITKLSRTSTLAITNTFSNVAWQVEDYDNLGAYDSGTSTTNIVVPTAIAWMRAHFAGSFANDSSRVFRELRLTDGATVYMGDYRVAQNENIVAIVSGWIAVAAGTTLTFQACSGGASDTLGSSFGGYGTLTIEWAASLSSLHA